MMKHSIIVPIYGVEPYLRKCVDSLLAQDLPSSEYEIILVDDGSPDGCPAICDQYAAEHDNIRVIHRENGGLSAARNAGIKAAEGEYICFVDSDDYWEPNVLGGLMAQVERDNLDVLRFDYQNVRINSARKYEVFHPNKYPHQVDIRHDVVDGGTYLDERMGYACYACQFVINRELTGMFTPGIHFEDTEWLPRMMLKAKRVNSNSTIVYNYFWREGSITLTQGNIEKIRKNLEDQLTIIRQYNTYIAQHPDCKWLYNMRSSMVAGVLTTVAREFYSERREYIARLREMKVFPLRIADQGKTYKRRATIINALGPKVYSWLMSYL